MAVSDHPCSAHFCDERLEFPSCDKRVSRRASRARAELTAGTSPASFSGTAATVRRRHARDRVAVPHGLGRYGRHVAALGLFWRTRRGKFRLSWPWGIAPGDEFAAKRPISAVRWVLPAAPHGRTYPMSAP